VLKRAKIRTGDSITYGIPMLSDTCTTFTRIFMEKYQQIVGIKKATKYCNLYKNIL
jgi:hypothetical protein